MPRPAEGSRSNSPTSRQLHPFVSIHSYGSTRSSRSSRYPRCVPRLRCRRIDRLPPVPPSDVDNRALLEASRDSAFPLTLTAAKRCLYQQRTSPSWPNPTCSAQVVRPLRLLSSMMPTISAKFCSWREGPQKMSTTRPWRRRRRSWE
jgi:hypothetical protein